MSYWKCRGCEATNNLTDAICSTCGKERTTGLVKCPNCGKKLTLGALGCATCEVAPSNLLGEQYSVQEVVGEGPTGLALRVWDNSRQSAVFVKVLSPSLKEDALQFDRLRNCVQVMARIRFFNCVRVLHWERMDSIQAIFYEWVDGVPLARLHLSTNWSTAQALAVIDGVLCGLSELHARGIAHGYLIPDRVLLDVQGISKISGVGLSCGDSPDAATLSFLAPEVVSGSGGEPDILADVYTAGRLLHTCVESAADFSASAPLIADIRTLVQTATAANPGQRLPTVTDFRDKLRRIADTHLGSHWHRDGTAELVATVSEIGTSELHSDRVGAAVPAGTSAVSGTSNAAASSEAVADETLVPDGSSRGLLSVAAAHPTIAVLASLATVVAVAGMVGGLYGYGKGASDGETVATSPSASLTASPQSAVANSKPAPVTTSTLPSPPTVSAAPSAQSGATPATMAANIPQGFSYWRTPYNDSGSGTGFTVALRQGDTFCTIPIQLDGGGDVVGVLTPSTKGTSWDGERSIYPEGFMSYSELLQASDGAARIIFVNSGEEWIQSTESAANDYSASMSRGTSNLSFFQENLTKWCK